MIYLFVIIIAIMQGVTEFLPVSSSGHIVLLKYIFHSVDKNFDLNQTFDVVIHMGTLLAVIIFYRQEITELILGLFKKKSQTKFFGELTQQSTLKIWLLFIIATIPAALSGFFLESSLDFKASQMTSAHFFFLAGCFSLTVIFLLATLFSQKKKGIKIPNIPILKGLFIGIAQAFAVLPGVSRSGSTISTALFLNVEKKDAGRFSFLLSIPLISAAFVLKLVELIKTPKGADNPNVLAFIIGFVVAFGVGYISLKMLIKIISSGKFWVFAFYMVLPISLSLIFGFLK